MDMNKLLSNLDSIEKGTFEGPVTKEKNEMKSILESLQSVSEGPMDMAPTMQEPEKVTMNVNLNAQGTDAISDLIKLMGGQGAGETMPPKMADTGDDEMAKLKAIMGPSDEMPEDYENEPDEEYADTQTMTKDLSGGLNREKKAFKAAQDGDNAMAVESIKDKLWAALNEKKDSAGIEAMKKAGNAKADAEAKERSKKKTEAVEGVCEDCGNPSWKTLPEEKQKGVDGKVCWKGYKRMGTKKKGGKTVDNCVKM